MAPTPSICAASLSGGASPRSRCGRAASTTRCSGRKRRAPLDLPRPIFLYVGRVAVEKNLEALLELELPGSTVIVGDGPGPRRARTPISRTPISLATPWRGFGADVRERRCVRLSLAHRHLRHRADRSAGERAAGRGLPGHRPARRDRHRRRASRRRPAAPPASRRWKFRAKRRANIRSTSPGGKARGSFSAMSRRAAKGSSGRNGCGSSRSGTPELRLVAREDV